MNHGKSKSPHGVADLPSLLWPHATSVRIESWGKHDPEYPGHDPGDATSREFRAYRVNERVFLLAKDNETGDCVRILANLPPSSSEIQARLEIESYDGWQRFGRIPGRLADKFQKFVRVISAFISPLFDADDVPQKLPTLIGSRYGDASYIQIRENKATVLALDSKRSSLHTGQFIYNECVINLLKALQFDVEQLGLVMLDRPPQHIRDFLWAKQAADQKTSRILKLRQKIEETDALLRSLQHSLNKEN